MSFISARLFHSFCTFAVCVGVMPQAIAEVVHKCSVDGKTVYQQAPCTTGGKTLNFQSGISAEAVQEANRRALDERKRADRSRDARESAEQTERYAAQPGLGMGGSLDCETLRRQYSDAWQRRRAATSGRTVDGLSGDAAEREIRRMDQKADDASASIGRAEARMKQAGCN